MKKFSNKGGFTLIEIIVVLIIIGILAAIALPNLFNNVQKSQAASALSTADGYKTPIEGCLALPANQTADTLPGVAPCDLITLFGAANKTVATLAGDGNFTVTIASASGNASSNNLTYQLVGADASAVNAFTLTRQTNGSFSCAPGAAGTVYSSTC